MGRTYYTGLLLDLIIVLLPQEPIIPGEHLTKPHGLLFVFLDGILRCSLARTIRMIIWNFHGLSSPLPTYLE
jgi:hypothetical protein